MFWKRNKRKKGKNSPLDERQKVILLGTDGQEEPKRVRVTVLTPQELLGVEICPSHRGYTTVRPHRSNTTRRDWKHRSIVVRQGPVDMAKVFMNLTTANESVTVVWRSVRKDISQILDNLDNAKKAKKNGKYHDLANALEKWVWSQGNNSTPFGWDCVYWGLSHDLIPEGEELTAALSPRFIARDFHVGNIMRSVINREAMNTRPTLDNALDNASPNLPKFRGHYLVYEGQVVVYFTGEFKKTSDGNLVATELLDKGFDILIRAEPREKLSPEGETTRVIFISPVIRYSFDIDEETTRESIEAKIGSIEATLRGLGSWKLIKGKHKLLKAFQAYVPGSPPPPWWKRYSIPKPNAFFLSLGKRVHKADRVKGDIPIGHFSDSPVCLDSEEDFAILVEGEQGSGKTTYALAALINSTTPFWIAAKMNADEKEALNYLGGDFGGTDLLLDLPDAENPEEQEQLMKGDILDALDLVAQVKAGCHSANYIASLPLVIRPVVDSIRFFEYALIVVEELTKWWQEFKRLNPEVPWLVLLLDDLRNLPAGEDDYLGDQAEKTGKKWKLWIFKIGGKIRKRFTRLVCTIHDLDEFKNPSWPRGTYGAFSTHIRVGLDNKFGTADVIRPKTQRYIYRNVELNLTSEIVRITGDR